MHRVVFGERKRPPHKTSKPLAQHVVEALHMTGLARAFARRPVLLLGQHLGVGRPKVRVEQAALVTSGDALPQQAAGLLAATADHVGEDLPRPAALGQSHPALVLAPKDERPEFIEFQRLRLLRGRQGLSQRRQMARFF